jgi:SAM-dependent methyltransferase
VTPASWRQRATGFVDLEAASLDRAMADAVRYATGRLVDVGCGNRPYEPLFRTAVSDYVGVEYHATFRGSVNDADAAADVYYNGEVLPFADGEFDTVLSNQVVEHVPDPRAHLAELARVLRPGGHLILTVPFSYREHAVPNDFHRFTQYALSRYCAEVALDVVVLRPRGGMWRAIGQKVNSHLAIDVARMTPVLQDLGSLTYEPSSRQRPRYWLLPVVAPALAVVAAGARLLDRIDPVPSDTLGYLLVAKKPETA